MEPSEIVARLGANAAVIRSLASEVSDKQARWRPGEGKWSILEVVNHLYDEERDDFRTRLRLTLEDPTQDWPPIDPERWAVEREYNKRDPAESLARFLDEREMSIEWLRGLESPDWRAAHVHPQAGSMTAGKILLNWLAHDLLHIRQLTRLHFEYVQREALELGPLGLRYAGDW